MESVGRESACLEAAISTVWGGDEIQTMRGKIKQNQSNITQCGTTVAIKYPQI